ncbi:hypothetical protein N656DRAFT_774708 [Canariomyces notabilis]|uniref:Lipoprotein n=1 Tax=Canariomyces notabilis TaxID=2074819 RepID=A0AAN6YXF7_9PEZI|nr:hypothetical protein N656DRAFT_774708 [Canariomyces arenarius]
MVSWLPRSPAPNWKYVLCAVLSAACDQSGVDRQLKIEAISQSALESRFLANSAIPANCPSKSTP